MEKKTEVSISDEFLSSLGWYELQPIAMSLVECVSDKDLHDKMIEIFPLENNQQYVGSLANHYRGRLKHHGKEALVNQMCGNSMRRLIIGLSNKTIDAISTSDKRSVATTDQTK